MADFQQKVQQKSAVRIFTIPIADVNAFNALVQDIIMNNPFRCVSYYTPGINHPPIEKVREMYTAKFVYTDSGRKTRGVRVRSLQLYHRFQSPALPQLLPILRILQPMAGRSAGTRMRTPMQYH